MSHRVNTENGERAATRPASAGALAGLALSMLLSSLGTSIANVALPTLAEAFGASFQQVQWVVLAYLLAVTTLIVSVGRLGDIAGRRLLLLAGLVLFTSASALCAAASSLWLLIVARFEQGLGAAVMMALTMALIGETVAKEKIGRAMGLLGTMSAIGTALGPSLGGVLIAGLGWRAIFLVNVPLGLAAVFLVYRFLPLDRVVRSADRTRFDIPGTLLLAGTLAAYALAMTIGHGRFDRLNVILLAAAILGAGAFVFVERKVVSPLIRLAAFRDAALSASLGMNALVSSVIMTTFVVGPFYLSRSLGLSGAAVGMVMSIGPIVSALSGILAGRAVDRLGANSTVIAGLVEMALGAFALCVLPSMFGLTGYIAGIVILTPGYQLFQAANNTAVMKDVHASQRGVVSGLLSLSRNLGLITGASLMGAVFAFASMTNDVTTAAPEAIAAGMRFTFAVAAILIVAAIVIGVAGTVFAARSATPDSAS